MMKKTKKLTISQAARKLAALGIVLGRGRTDLEAKPQVTYYNVTIDGVEKELSSTEIIQMVST